MKVFLSWSGKFSKDVSKCFGTWLPNVIQSVTVFQSEEISKGSKWFDEISQKLKTADFCIVFLTPNNMSSSWINFESGAISNKFSKGKVSSLLIGLEPDEVVGPLRNFQHTLVQKEDIRRLVGDINENQSDGNKLNKEHLDSSFEKWYPDLEKELQQITENSEESEGYSQKEMLSEIHEISRSQYSILHEVYRSNIKILRGNIFGYDFSGDLAELIEELSSMRNAEVIRLYFGIEREHPLNEFEIAERFDLQIEEVFKFLHEGIKELNDLREAKA